MRGQVPVVHFGTGTGEFLNALREAGADVVGVDHRVPLDEASRRLGGGVPVQGNIDPALLAAPWQVLEAHVRDVVARGAAAPAHVVNLGHGVPPDTNPDADPAGRVGACAVTIRIATRASALALTQATWVGERLAEASGDDFELVHVTTEGDVRPESLASLGGQGVFIAAVRQALLDGRSDIAVHSLKDLPSGDHPDLVFGALPAREAPMDVLCARDGLTMATLPAGARVGTGSPRRAAQLRLLRPDLVVVDIRGNVPTRLRRITTDLDAVVLARAGLARLGLLDAVTEELAMVTAGQGALAIECRPQTAAAGTPLAAALAALDDTATRLETTAERAVLAGLGASCTTPVGARGRYDGRLLRLDAVLLVASRAIRAAGSVPVSTPGQAAAAGAGLADELRAAAPSIAVLREQPGALAQELADAGVTVVHCPVVRTEALPATGLAEQLAWLAGGWLVVTSPRTVDFLTRLAERGVPDAALAGPGVPVDEARRPPARPGCGRGGGEADAERLVEADARPGRHRRPAAHPGFGAQPARPGRRPARQGLRGSRMAALHHRDRTAAAGRPGPRGQLRRRAGRGVLTGGRLAGAGRYAQRPVDRHGPPHRRHPRQARPGPPGQPATQRRRRPRSVR